MSFHRSFLPAMCCTLAALAFGGANVYGGAIRAGFNSTPGPTLNDTAIEITKSQIGFDVNFFGVTLNDTSTKLFLNENGILSFGSVFSTQRPGTAPFEGPSSGGAPPLIAPFWADVHIASGGSVAYGTGTVGGAKAWGATWTDVAYFSGPFLPPAKLNSFQVILIDQGSGNFIIEFNYDFVEWNASNTMGGLNGIANTTDASGQYITAVAGWSAGDGKNSFVIDGEGVQLGYLDGQPTTLVGRSNMKMDDPEFSLGRWRFGVVQGVPGGGGNGGAVPEPSSILLAALGAVGAIGYRIRRRKQTPA